MDCGIETEIWMSNDEVISEKNNLPADIMKL